MTSAMATNGPTGPASGFQVRSEDLKTERKA